MYVLSRLTSSDLGYTSVSDSVRGVLLLASWLDDAQVVGQVYASLLTLDNAYRIVADTFLVSSLLVDWITRQNDRGITVDLNQSIFKFIKLWSFRPMANRVEDRLVKLTWDRNVRRRFGVDLRREWLLSRSSFPESRDLPITVIKNRVFFNSCQF